MSEEYTVFFKPKQKKTSVTKGTTLLEAALEIGLKIRHTCGGSATCGTCRVHIAEGDENLSPVNEREVELLGEDRIQSRHRLACQSKVFGSVTAEIPSWLPLPQEEKS